LHRPCLNYKAAYAYLQKSNVGSSTDATKKWFASYTAVQDLIKEVAAGKNATPAQIALAWVLAQKTWIVLIPGTRKLERLAENQGAADFGLTAEELRELNDAFSKIEISGERYPAEYAKRWAAHGKI
jgi:aryl-alcohol dehydrogenase-like predicted oxidoreductase